MATQFTGDAILRPAKTLEFIRASGSKGLGDLLTAQQLKERWGITDDEYANCSTWGLPIDR